ncbi:MAG: hypothetical protein K0Q94_4736, partial [Paenibacillus sp.]|nr:hypothetical protein [Paenibacillus sp.]
LAKDFYFPSGPVPPGRLPKRKYSRGLFKRNCPRGVAQEKLLKRRLLTNGNGSPSLKTNICYFLYRLLSKLTFATYYTCYFLCVFGHFSIRIHSCAPSPPCLRKRNRYRATFPAGRNRSAPAPSAPRASYKKRGSTASNASVDPLWDICNPLPGTCPLILQAAAIPDLPAVP